MFRWSPLFRTLSHMKHTKYASSSIPSPALVLDKQRNADVSEVREISQSEDDSKLPKGEEGDSAGAKSKLVAAAFASLKANTSSSGVKLSALDKKIAEAKSVDALLSLTETSVLSRRQALKIVSTLAEWSVTNQVKTGNFESDQRFVSLCQLLGRPVTNRPVKINTRPGDLNMVLGVKDDDEAAKLMSSFSLQQMLKVAASLAYKKRRSLPLLRSLAFNISRTSEKLNVKEAADILYTMSVLNFPDEVLLEKVCCDLCEVIPQCQKTAVIGSIATSLGLLRYKDVDVLETLGEWCVRNLDICRNQDLVSILHTMAFVNYLPSNTDNFFATIKSRLTKDLIPSANLWLDAVWSLVVLERASTDELKSVLTKEFINRLSNLNPEGLSVSCKRKLLNINGVAKWTKGYKGDLLDDVEEINGLPLGRSKDKQALVSSVLDALSNLFPSPIYLRTNVNTGMGFVLEGECLVDSKMTPLPVIDKKSGEPIIKQTKGNKIAILVWDYHDHTKGKVELNGSAVLCNRLAKLSGLKVMSVPYTEYGPSDSLVSRVQYLESSLKLLVQPS